MSQQEEQHSPLRGVAAVDWPGIWIPFVEVLDFRWPRQTHAYRDLIMPIDSTEKRLFDAIDGNHSIGGIVERTLPSAQTKSQVDVARTCFEKLWWYDQVVFDASRCGVRKEEA